MSPETNDQENSDGLNDPDDVRGQAGAKGRSGRVTAAISLVSMVIAGVAMYISLTMEIPRPADYSAQISRLESSLADMRSRNGELQRELQGLQQSQSEILASLAEDNSREDMSFDAMLAEIEQLLIIASHRLALAGDVNTALAAMQAVQDRIKNIDEPALLNFRRQLTADMNSLNSVNSVDIPGLALYLADITARVDSLPLSRLQTEVEQEETGGGTDETEPSSRPWYSRLGDEVTSTLKELVKIYPEGQGTVISLLPEQRYYLYQNLRLQIEIARLSALRQETENFRVSIRIVQDWMEKYFDMNDTGVANVITSLSGMSNLELKPQLPDISSSLETLRALMRGPAFPAPE